MDKILIENWNNKITKNDEVYILGDFAFHLNMDEIKEYCNKLNGRKYLIIGNHDDRKIKNCGGFLGIYDIFDIKINYKHIIMCHYPMLRWNRCYNGSWHLFGHVHNQKESFGDESPLYKIKNSMNVGVDVHPNYEPFSYKEIEEFMNKNYES